MKKAKEMLIKDKQERQWIKFVFINIEIIEVDEEEEKIKQKTEIHKNFLTNSVRVSRCK